MNRLKLKGKKIWVIVYYWNAFDNDGTYITVVEDKKDAQKWLEKHYKEDLIEYNIVANNRACSCNIWDTGYFVNNSSDKAEAYYYETVIE